VKKTLSLGAALLLAGALALGGCAQDSSTGNDPATGAAADQGGAAETTVVIDASYDYFETVDPARERSSLGALTVHALYDTLVTYAGEDMSTVVDGLASMEIADEFKTFTFTLDPDRHFATGNPVTADDVIFSLTRVQNIGSNSSPYYAGMTFTKVDDLTVVITTEEPKADLPAIIASEPSAIVEQAVVEAAGGTADETDAAEASLNVTAAGSGPYQIEKADFTGEVVLVKNANYDGPNQPGFDRVVIRNADASTQKMSLEAGDTQVALDLSPAEAATLDPSMVYSAPSVSNVYLITSFEYLGLDALTGIRAAIDYDALVELAGAGARQSTAIVPRQFAGAAPESATLKHDLEAAKPLAAAFDKTIKLSYLSDASIYGLQFTSLAEKLQAQLQEAGFQVELAPTPGATFWDSYSSGTLQMGLAYWLPDYLDASGYLVFAPPNSYAPDNAFGQTFANWKTASDEFQAAVEAAYAATDEAERKAAFEKFGELSNQESPFIPLFQPAINIGHAADVTGVAYNAAWTIDVALLKPAA
jgi:peptide/nickel transport system substrate-binding protein